MNVCEKCPKKAYYGLKNERPRFCRLHKETNMINVCVPLCGYEGCPSTSKAFGYPGQKGTHCKKHALSEMVNVVNKLCDHPGCLSTSRVFGLLKSKKRYCKEHATTLMTNLVNPTCQHSGCTSLSKNFDSPGGKGRFCKLHKKDGMVDVRNQTCIHPGCSKRPNFSIKGTPARYCSQHKQPGMCNRNACNHDTCTVTASYNYPHETVAKFCASHKLDGMVNVHVRLCTFAGCKKSASFGTRTPTHCKEHSDDSMRNIVAKLCEHPDCDIHASYNLPNHRPRFCKAHIQTGMVCVIGKGCEHPSCKSKSRYYDIPGGKGRFCTHHKQPGMIDVQNPRCSECDSLASYGIPGGKRTRCAQHRMPGTLSRPRAKCKVCRKPACYGKDYIALHCETHKHPDDDNIMERECVSCHLVMVLDSNNRCEFCNPERFQTNRLAKQTALMDYLNRRGLKGNATDIVIEHGVCGKERPDRVFDFDDKIVILECDEHQHKDRQCLCEQTRMVNIAQSYGGVPVYFIRWNPDNYVSIGSNTMDAVVKRHQLVARYIEEIQFNIVALPDALVSVLYMYYDGWDGVSNAEWTVLTPFEQEP